MCEANACVYGDRLEQELTPESWGAHLTYSKAEDYLRASARKIIIMHKELQAKTNSGSPCAHGYI